MAINARRLFGLGASVGASILVMSLITASAQGAVFVGQGVAKVRLGDSQGLVRQLLGEPFRETGGDWVYAKPCLCFVGFRHGQVHDVETLSKSQRTSKGIGPGASYDQTTAAYPEATCRHTAVYGPESMVCSLLSTYKGEKVITKFEFFEKSLGMRDLAISLR